MVLEYSKAAGNGRAERGTFTISRTDCGAPRRRTTPNFEEDILHCIEETPSMITQTIARGMGVPHSTVWEVCMSSNYTFTIPRGYMQWIQPILHSVLISVCGFYTVLWKSHSFHDRYSSPMNVGSLGMLLLTHKTAMCGMMKTPMPIDSSNVSALVCGQILWTAVWKGLTFFIPV